MLNIKDSVGRVLHIPETDQGTCRVPVYPGNWSGYLQGTCRVPVYPWNWSGYLQGTCIPLKLIRVPAGYLYTPETDQGTCRNLYTSETDQGVRRVPVYPWNWSGYRYTPETDQSTCREPVYPWNWSGYLQGTAIPLKLIRIWRENRFLMEILYPITNLGDQGNSHHPKRNSKSTSNTPHWNQANSTIFNSGLFQLPHPLSPLFSDLLFLGLVSLWVIQQCSP